MHLDKINNSIISRKYGLSSIKNNPTTLYEVNVACITQISYIKANRTKHISPKLFYEHEF